MGDAEAVFPYLLKQKTDPAHPYLFWRQGSLSAVRAGPWKLLLIKNTPAQLYNLLDDPGETRNLYSSQKQTAKMLGEELTRWSSTLAPPLWLNEKF